MEHIQSTIERYGGNPELFLRFAGGDPRVLSYATIINAQSTNSTRFASPESAGSGNPIDAVVGVYEQQTAPLIFLVDGDSIGDDENQFGAIRRSLALRGDTPYLGVVRGGQLLVHHISLEPLGPRESLVHELVGKDQAATFPLLANVRPGTESKRRDNRNWISIVIRDLLESSIKVLLQNTTTSSDSRIADNDAISLVGRALFLRFLGDRDLLPEHLNPIEEIFDSAERAEEASFWLDQTFNGDFLPYSPGLFGHLSDPAMHTLGNIVCRAPRGQLHLEFPDNWNRLDFAHIPVGVLSEAYEAYMRARHPKKQEKEGAYYTPPFIVDTMVRASFAALRREGRSDQAVVLDPAVGAGVFLISAFRQLAEERWRQDGRRPDTAALRDILYNHLTGFDINEAALRFAALGLYLMAVELDPEPEPVDKLRFHTNLSGTVLHDFGQDDANGPGSLGSFVSTCHNGRYDLVIGNPPWTRGGDKEKSNQILKTVQTIAQQRLGNVPSLESLLPRQVMDLPFVWRAMEWAKPGARIAFALHARMLFQQGNGMPEARASLFSAVDVTAIVNGSDLRKTPVWPSVSAPFCMFFARNRLPTVGGGFRFVSPHLEQRLNDSGIIRIDTTNAAWVTPTEVRQCAPILKILFRGSSLDLKIYDKIRSRPTAIQAESALTLNEYWMLLFGKDKGKPRQTGNGYKKSHKGKHTNRVVNDWMAALLDLGNVEPASMLLDVAALPKVGTISLGRQRDEEIYRGPLLLIHESPPSDSARIRTIVCDDDVAYNRSWYGYSAKGQPDAELLVRYLALVLGSKFTMWWALITAGTFGVERDRLDLSVVKKLPIVPLETLDADSRNMITKLFDALVQAKTQRETEATWSQVDKWAASLYRLSSHDQQVIHDTLRFGLPFADNVKKAQEPVTDVDIREFRTVLREDLDVWASPEGLSIDVELITHLPKGSPWHVLKIGTKQGTHQSCDDWAEILRTANDIAASEVVMPNNDTRTIQVARLSQARYWTRTHAHLLAQKIVWEHLDTLLGGESV